MTTLTRTFSVTYGSLTIGGISGNYLLHGPVIQSAVYQSSSFRAFVIVKGTNAADLESKCTALTNYIRVPRANLVVVQGSDTKTFTEQTNAVSIGASMERAPGQFDSHVTRAFIVDFVVQHTADDTSDQGLVDYGFIVTTGKNGIRLISLKATYTQYNGDSAEAVYLAGFNNLVSTVQLRVDSDNTIEWEESPRVLTHDRFNQSVSVSVTITERIFSELADDSFDDAIFNQFMMINIVEGYVPTALPGLTCNPVTYMLQYSCEVDSTFTKELIDVYNTISRPKIVDYTQTIANQNQNAIGPLQTVTENIICDPVTNTIRAEIMFRVYGISEVLSATLSTGYRYKPPVQKVPTYDIDGMGRMRIPGLGAASYVCRVIVLVRGDPSKALSYARSLALKPTRKTFGGPYRALDNRPMSRQNYNDIGISGGEWTFEGEQDDYEGPYDDNGDPPNQLTGCTLTQSWDYDTDPQNVQGGSYERGGVTP